MHPNAVESEDGMIILGKIVAKNNFFEKISVEWLNIIGF
jgi:hypothetical protein